MAVMGRFRAMGDFRKAFFPLAGSRIRPWLCLSDHMRSTMCGGVKN